VINTEAGKVLVEYSKHIARWAKQGDRSIDKRTPTQQRAGEFAWRLLCLLLTFGEHVKASDLNWMLLHIAQKNNKPVREQARLLAAAKREDFRYMEAKAELERVLAEMLKKERDNPKALIDDTSKGGRPAAKKVSSAAVPKKVAKTSVKATKASTKVALKKVAPGKKATAAGKRKA
jgi:hypothetical protein